MGRSPVAGRLAWSRALIVAALAVVPAAFATAQSPGAATAPTLDAEPGPVALRDATGRMTIRATRIAEPLKIDGKLDEAVFEQVPAITEHDFVQAEPDAGAPLSERTEAWVLYDDRN